LQSVDFCFPLLHGTLQRNLLLLGSSNRQNDCRDRVATNESRVISRPISACGVAAVRATHNRRAAPPVAPGEALSARSCRSIRRLDPHSDPGAAINALAALLRAKRRRGYQDRTG
jgi:hypothetical protein